MQLCRSRAAGTQPPPVCRRSLLEPDAEPGMGTSARRSLHDTRSQSGSDASWRIRATVHHDAVLGFFSSGASALPHGTWARTRRNERSSVRLCLGCASASERSPRQDPTHHHRACCAEPAGGAVAVSRHAKRMARPVRKDEYTGRVGLKSTYPATAKPWPRWSAHASSLIKFRVSCTTSLPRLSKRRLDRYAICFSPPQSALPARCPDAIVSADCMTLVFEGTTVTQHRPYDPCQLGGECDDHNVGVSPGEQLAYPFADPRGCPGKMRQSGASAMD